MQIGRGQRDDERKRREKEWKKKVCHVCVPTAHGQCNCHILQICTNKKLKLKRTFLVNSFLLAKIIIFSPLKPFSKIVQQKY